MNRLTLLVVAIVVLVPTAGIAQVDAPPVADSIPGSPELDPKIDWLVAPLSHAPAIQTATDGLQVELAAERDASALGDHRATLVPSFGVVRPPIELGAPTAVRPMQTSRLWPGRTVHQLTFDLPADTPDDLYDLVLSDPEAGMVETVRSPAGTTMRRAVRIVEQVPDAPRVAVIADPSAGDPRPIQEGVTEMLPPGLPYPEESSGDLTALPPKVIGTAGNPAEGEGRWAAFERAVAEINLAKPDLVLIPGDLTFAVHARALPYEFEDAWRILDALEVPSFASPGNHDLYSLDVDRYELDADRPSTADGQEEWQRYFGPLHYAVDIGPAFHLVSLNTFDHEYLFPFPPPEFPTIAAGHVGPEQLGWLAADLAAYRARNPDGALVTLAHHDPSWLTGNHPWVDRGNRNAVRQLMHARDVWVHFSGHTHEDRIARYHRGSIVETNGRQHKSQYPIGALHHLDVDAGDADPGRYSQAELAAIVADPAHGPLFVSTTSAGSGLIGDVWGLGSYWGWRLAHLTPAADGGYPAAAMGYATAAPLADVRAFLDAHAERPGRWNEAHAALGVHSIPSHQLSATRSADGSQVTVHNPLLDDLSVEVRLVVAATDPAAVSASGGEIVRSRAGDGVVEVWVRAVVEAGSALEITAIA